MKTMHHIALGIVGALAVSACDLDIGDLNNPGIDELRNSPTPDTVNAAATGLLIGNRAGHGAENGYVTQMGVLGREAYCFDSADPRFISELLERSLNRGSPFGGNFWAAPYSNIQLANILLGAVDKVPEVDLPASAKSGIKGFARTIQALDLLRVISTRDTNGAVIDTNRDVSADLAPIVDAPTTYAKINELLDAALPELAAGGDAFSFKLDTGFRGLDTPATFTKFNRAIRARVAVYTKDYKTALTALTASFIADTAPIDFTIGAYYTYTTKGGDVLNGLATPNIRVHASVKAAADPADKRYLAKVGAAKSLGGRGLSSEQIFKLYPDPTSPISLIRNEELILLRAEALWFAAVADGGDKLKAIAELDLVRQGSGGLPASTILPTATDAEFTLALLNERRFSLLFEGHRLIDLRRFKLTADKTQLPVEHAPPTDPPDPMFPDGKPHTVNVRWPIPQPECNARPGEAACMKGSTDPAPM